MSVSESVDQSASNLAIVDLYMARGRLRAEIPMMGFSRLSDLFNNTASDFLGGSMRMAATGSAVVGELSMVRRDLVVRLRDVRLVRPIDERRGPVILDNLRERIAARVVLDLDDWQVTGDLQLVDRIRWLDYAAAVRGRFISVNNASVRFVGVSEPLDCPYMLVNGSRISALYEVV